MRLANVTALLMLIAALCMPALALESQVPIQVGSTILVAVTPSDDAESTVLMIFSTDETAVRLWVEYTRNGVTVGRAAQRSGPTADKYAVIIIHVPIQELHPVIENLANGHRDSF